MSFHLRLALPSHPRFLSVVRAAVSELGVIYGLPNDECIEVTLAVDEAVANVIRHAYPRNHTLTALLDKWESEREQMLALIGAIEDVHDLCLMHVGIFCGLRASEIMGLQWKSWTGEALIPHGTAYDGRSSREE